MPGWLDNRHNTITLLVMSFAFQKVDAMLCQQMDMKSVRRPYNCRPYYRHLREALLTVPRLPLNFPQIMFPQFFAVLYSRSLSSLARHNNQKRTSRSMRFYFLTWPMQVNATNQVSYELQRIQAYYIGDTTNGSVAADAVSL
jgi:hypothetical protein